MEMRCASKLPYNPRYYGELFAQKNAIETRLNEFKSENGDLEAGFRKIQLRNQNLPPEEQRVKNYVELIALREKTELDIEIKAYKNRFN